MWFSNRSVGSVYFFSIIKLSILLLAASMVPLSALAAPAQKIGVPEWSVPTTISTDDGYADLLWERPDGAFSEMFKITESRPGSQRQYYVDGTGMHVYRVEPGWYDFKIAACQKNAQGSPLCGQDSGKLRLTVTAAIYDTFPHNQSQSPVQTLSAPVAGGPDQLRPGLWYDPSKSGQGWSFYWANRLALPESSPLFENAYDLVGVYYTFESKNDPSQPGEPAPLDSYRPVVVTFKGVLTGANTYSGNMSIVRQGATDSTGSAVVTFGANNTTATIDWDMHFKLEYLSDVDSLSLLLGPDPSSINNKTHYSGLWEHATDDSYFVVNDIANIAEAATLVFYDNVGDPVWLQAVNSGSAVSSNTYLCFSYLTEGYRANRSPPGAWSQVWYDSGCNSGQTASSTNRNGRRYFSDFGTERFWASFTLAGIDYSIGSVTVGSYSSPAYLGKNANFHGISYDYIGGSSCVMTDATPSCTASLTWFTDSDYPNATAYAYNQTTATRTKILTSSEPAMENQTHVITSAGVYVFELRMGNSASAELIAQSSTFTVTSEITSGPPVAPTALQGSWDDQANSQYTIGWLHSDTQDVARYEIEETKPDGTISPLYTVSPGSNLSLSFNKSTAAQGHYQYRVRACNAVGCSTYSGTLNWYTDEPVSTLVFADDFETIKGWTANLAGTDTATTGKWERANPEQTSSGATIYQLGTTVSGLYDLVTEGTAGSGVGINDIDNGVTTITSPSFGVPAGAETTLSFHYYLAHSTSSSEDFFRVYADTSGSDVLLLQELGSTTTQSAVWTEVALDLSTFAGQTIRIRFEAADNYPGDFVEAGVDDVTVNVSSSGGPQAPVFPNGVNPPGLANTAVVDFRTAISDADGDTMNCSVTGGLPNGLSLSTVGNAECVISGTAYDTVGNYTFTLQVTDIPGGESSSVPVVWAMQNTPPFFDAATTTLQITRNAQVTRRLAVGDVDPGQTLTCSLSSGTLPGGLSFSSNPQDGACVISGLTTVQAGTYNISFSVTDGITSKNSGTVVLEVIDALVEFKYDARGRLVQITNNAGQAATYSLDDAGNRLALESDVGEPTITTFMAPDIALYSDPALGNFVTLMWASEATSGCNLTLSTSPGTQSHPANHQITLQLTQYTTFDLSCYLGGATDVATKAISLTPASQ